MTTTHISRFVIVGMLACSLGGWTACGEDASSGVTTDCVSTIERVAVLGAAAARIDATLTAWQTAQGELAAALEALAITPNEQNLVWARQQLERARLGYAQVAPYSLVIDPSQTVLPHVAAFPTDTAVLTAYVGGERFPEQASVEFDRGYPAVEFLLYGPDTTKAIDLLRDNPARVALLRPLSLDLSERATFVAAAWTRSGRDAFTAALGTDAGSGLGMLINSINKHYEDARRDQLGLPFGVALGFPSPRVLQAPYSRMSRELLSATVEASAAAFGRPTESNSLAGYVAGLGTTDGAGVATDIANQYRLTTDALARLGAPLFTAVVDERDAVQAVYTAMSRQVVFLKTDLPGVTCVAITYVDNPSDSD